MAKLTNDEFESIMDMFYDEDKILLDDEIKYYVKLRDDLDNSLAMYKAEIEDINNMINVLLKSKKSLYISKYKPDIDWLNKELKDTTSKLSIIMSYKDVSKIEYIDYTVSLHEKTYAYVRSPNLVIDQLMAYGSKVVASAVKTFDKKYIKDMYNLGMIDSGLAKTKSSFIKVLRHRL